MVSLLPRLGTCKVIALLIKRPYFNSLLMTGSSHGYWSLAHSGWLGVRQQGYLHGSCSQGTARFFSLPDSLRSLGTGFLLVIPWLATPGSSSFSQTLPVASEVRFRSRQIPRWPRVCKADRGQAGSSRTQECIEVDGLCVFRQVHIQPDLGNGRAGSCLLPQGYEVSLSLGAARTLSQLTGRLLNLLKSAFLSPPPLSFLLEPARGRVRGF